LIVCVYARSRVRVCARVRERARAYDRLTIREQLRASSLHSFVKLHSLSHNIKGLSLNIGGKIMFVCVRAGAHTYYAMY